MKQLKLYIILLLFTLINLSAKSQMLSVQAKVDTNIILLGDQVKFYLEVNQPENFNLKFPILTDTLIDKIEILEDLGFDTTINDNQLIVRHKYLITSFDSGIYIVPPIKFTFQSYIDSTIDTIATVPLYFGVQTVALDTANPDKIADIKLPYKAPLTFKEVLPYLEYGLAALLIIAFIIYYFIKRKKNEPILKRRPKPKEPAHIVAYRGLDKLKKDKLWQKNLIKEFHSQLTEIIRVYVEDRFKVPAMEQTTDEILESFNKNKLLDSILLEAIRKMLQQADLVKFAKSIPLADENEQSLKDAYLIVDRTKEVFRSLNDEENVQNTKIVVEEPVKAIPENNKIKTTDL